MIDVLLPFYGDPGLMRATVRSVLAQTDPDFRLVVVDDGYPDDSIGPWFAGLEDARVEYHRNAVNLGANRNYTRALELATAEHVVVMGADDLLLPRYLAVVREALRAFPDAAVVQCGVEVIEADGVPAQGLLDRVKRQLRPTVSAPTALRGEEAICSLLRGNWTYFPSLCWSTERIRAVGFRPDFHVVQDLALLVDVLIAGGELVVTPETAFQYRRHAGSDSSVKTLSGSRFEEEAAYFAAIAEELRGRSMPRAARRARWHTTSRLHAGSLVPTALAHGQLADTRRLVRHAVALRGPNR